MSEPITIPWFEFFLGCVREFDSLLPDLPPCRLREVSPKWFREIGNGFFFYVFRGHRDGTRVILEESEESEYYALNKKVIDNSLRRKSRISTSEATEKYAIILALRLVRARARTRLPVPAYDVDCLFRDRRVKEPVREAIIEDAEYTWVIEHPDCQDGCLVALIVWYSMQRGMDKESAVREFVAK